MQEDLAEDGTEAEKKEASEVSIKKEGAEEEEGAAKTIEGSQAQVRKRHPLWKNYSLVCFLTCLEKL